MHLTHYLTFYDALGDRRYSESEEEEEFWHCPWDEGFKKYQFTQVRRLWQHTILTKCHRSHKHKSVHADIIEDDEITDTPITDL